MWQVVGQKPERFREFWTPFLLRVIRKHPRSILRACVEGDGAICSINRKIVPYHGANPNTSNGARLRSPSPIMAPDYTEEVKQRQETLIELSQTTLKLACSVKTLACLVAISGHLHGETYFVSSLTQRVIS